MADTPRVSVSVIVPVYNAEKTIGRCLESILAQTMTDLEIIVVDDGTPDGAMDIVGTYAVNDPRIRIIHQENAGLGAARNAGIKAAAGDYLAFVDSDDFIEPSMLETMLDAAQHAHADVVNAETFIDIFDESDKLVKSSVLPLPLEGDRVSGFEAFKVFSVLVPPVLNSVCFKLIRRTLFQDTGMAFPEAYRFAEDMPVTAQAFLNSPTVALVHEPLYHYVRSSSVLTSSFSLKKANDLIEDMEEICHAAQEAGYSDSLDPFKLEMLFSVIRQITWSGETTTAEGKALLGQVAALKPKDKLNTQGVDVPFMQKAKMTSVASGTAPALCKIAYALRWIPTVKHLM